MAIVTKIILLGKKAGKKGKNHRGTVSSRAGKERQQLFIWATVESVRRGLY